VFVDADGKIMALIPIVNSAETGKIDESTREIFIEVSGTDIHSCKAALNILVCTFADMGGQVHEVLMDYGKEKFTVPDLGHKRMELDAGEVQKMLGIKLTEKDIKTLLGKMGYGYLHGVVHIPPYRADVMSTVDIIEDIAIAYGYNNFKPTLPDFFNPGEIVKTYDNADAIMRGMGFLENKTFILTNKDNLGKIGFGGKAVQISNPSTVDFTVVRPGLVVNMLESFSINKMKGLPQKFYEIGIVHDGREEKRLAFGIMDRKIEFSEFRGYLQTLAFESGFEFQLKKSESRIFGAEISGVIISKGREIGIFGKVSGSVLEKFGIGFDVYLCELKA
jgi:phenylalanyl-tRNA synthetase beta chain